MGFVMENRGYNELVEDLGEVKQHKRNWYAVADLTQQIRGAADGPKQQSKRMENASIASGFSVNTLNRMLGVKSYYDVAKEKVSFLNGINPNDLSFPSLEIIKRWHHLDPSLATNILIEVINDRMPYRELRKQYNLFVAANTSSATAHQVARLKFKDFEDEAFKSVKSSLGLLIDESLQPTLSLSADFPISIGALIYIEHSSQPFAGVEFVLYRQNYSAKNTLEALMHRLLFSASFFYRFWIIFSSSIGADRAKIFCSLLDELDRQSIGVAVLQQGEEFNKAAGHNQLRIERTPFGEPIPDWRNKIQNYGNLRAKLIG